MSTPTAGDNADQISISAPGVYTIPAQAYHRDPVEGGSLSSTGARLLTPPSTPAHYRHATDNPAPYKKTFSLGHAAHELVLGAGPGIVQVEAGDWRTKAAQSKRDEAVAAGLTPLLTHEHEQVQAMADAIRRHPRAGRLFDPARGRPEQTLVWRDAPTGVWCRALIDWLPQLAASGRLVLADYKTCESAGEDAIEKAVYRYGYHMQDAWYRGGAEQLGLAEHVVFAFVFQEKAPPYLVHLIELDAAALRIGRALNRAALNRYAECAKTRRWPGYEDISYISLPGWVEHQYQEVM